MQNYKSHIKLTPMFHGVLYLSLIAFLACSILNLKHHMDVGDNSLQPWLFIGISFIFFLFTYFIRSFPLQAQDRIIRAEENMRHYVLAGKLLDEKLSMSQIISLRFASDAEFITLAKRTVQENLSSKDIKKAIMNWKEDNHRM